MEVFRNRSCHVAFDWPFEITVLNDYYGTFIIVNYETLIWKIEFFTSVFFSLLCFLFSPFPPFVLLLTFICLYRFVICVLEP